MLISSSLLQNHSDNENYILSVQKIKHVSDKDNKSKQSNTNKTNKNIAPVTEKQILINKTNITPFYINTDRMLDECAILSDGYSTFSEVAISSSSSSSNKAKMGFGARFKAWLIKFDLNGEFEMSNSGAESTATRKEKVHTTASLLHKLVYGLCDNITVVNDKASSIKVEIGELCIFSDVKLIAEKTILPWKKTEANIALLSYETFRLSLLKRYSKLNGLKDRILVSIKTPISDNMAGYTYLSPEFFYQSQFSDFADLNLKCICKIIGGVSPKYRYEIIALFI